MQYKGHEPGVPDAEMLYYSVLTEQYGERKVLGLALLYYAPYLQALRLLTIRLLTSFRSCI